MKAKKVLALALVLALAMTLLPTVALGAESDFIITNGVLTKYNGSGGNVFIPDGVTSIGIEAFYHCAGLTSVTIPTSVTSIETGAFASCESLTSATIPSSVTRIGNSAFSNCMELTNIIIPNSVTSIGDHAFSHCASLTSVTIPGSVTRMGWVMFDDCTSLISATIQEGVTSITPGMFRGCTSLTNVTIPASVTSIREDAFGGCTSLTKISVASGNEKYVTLDGILFRADMATLVAYPAGKVGPYVIPNEVTTIGGYAFSDCTGLTDVTIPNSVTRIEYFAFTNCTGLTSVTIPGSLICDEEDILEPDSIFSGCTNLANVTIQEGVTHIADAMFSGCTSLSSVTIPSSVTSIGDAVFWDCAGLKTVKVLSKEASFNGEVFSTDSFYGSPDLTVYGYAGSTAEVYCKEYNIPFDLLENAPADPSPSPSPSAQPSTAPSAKPSTTPSAKPSTAPSMKPSESPKPSAAPVAVTGVTLPKTASVQVGKTKTLTATVTPRNAENKSVYWTSDDTYVVSVDTNGKVTGVKTGTANVTVTTVDGGFTATCAVTVYTSSSGGGGGGSSSGGSGASGGGGGGGGAAKPSAAPSAKPIVTSKPASENFSDVVKDSWYEAGVTYVVRKGLFNGVAQGQFAPQQNMTRAMLVTVLARLDGQATSGGTTWYQKGADWAKAQGVSDGTMLDQSVTREQMVAMLYRYAKAPAGTADLSAFADGATVSDWAREAMAWAVSKGILTGKDGSRLDPQGTATRAEVATILQRFVEKK